MAEKGEKPQYDAQVDADATMYYKVYRDAAENLDKAVEYKEGVDRLGEIAASNPIQRLATLKEEVAIRSGLPKVEKVYNPGSGTDLVYRPYDGKIGSQGVVHHDALAPDNVHRAEAHKKAAREVSMDHFEKNAAAIEDNAVIMANADFIARGSNERIRTAEVAEEQLEAARKLTGPRKVPVKESRANQHGHFS